MHLARFTLSVLLIFGSHFKKAFGLQIQAVPTVASTLPPVDLTSTQTLPPVDLTSTPTLPPIIELMPPYCSSEDSPNSNSSFPRCSSPNLEILTKHGRQAQANEPRDNGGIPSWVNLKLAKLGQVFANRNFASVMMSHLCGLISSLVYDDSIEMLLFSGHSEDPQKSLMRYMSTITQVIVWYDDLLFGLPETNTSDILSSLVKVHQLHAAVQKAAGEQYEAFGYLVNNSVYADYELTTALKYEFYEDFENSDIPSSQRIAPPSNCFDPDKVPFNQQVQALTQFAFAGTAILYPERYGIVASEEELWGFNHLWAIIGYTLGLDDKYNLALQPDLQTQKKVYKEVFEKYAIPVHFATNHQGKALLENALKGFVGMNYLPPNAALYMCATHVFNIPAPLTASILTLDERALVDLLELQYLPNMLIDPLFTEVVNEGLRAMLFSAGVQLFGNDYLTRESRARNCFYAKYQ